jgi:nitroreductase
MANTSLSNDLLDVLRTNASARSFTSRPITDEQLFRILDTARFAPSGGNKQGWHVVVVKDPSTRAEICQLSKRTWNEYAALVAAGQRPFAADTTGHWPGPGDVDLDIARATDAPWLFSDGFVDEPVVLVVAVDITVLAGMDCELDRIGVSAGGSIYPFVQNILLASRTEGFGGVMTTFLARQEPAAQKLLGLPAHLAIAALVVLGEPAKQVQKLTRKPVSEFATVDRFDGPAFSS